MVQVHQLKANKAPGLYFCPVLDRLTTLRFGVEVERIKNLDLFVVVRKHAEQGGFPVNEGGELIFQEFRGKVALMDWVPSVDLEAMEENY